MLHIVYSYSILHLQNTFYARLWRDLKTLINKESEKPSDEESHTCPYFVKHLHTNTEKYAPICRKTCICIQRHCMSNCLSETVHYVISNEHVVIYKIMYFIYMCSANLQNMHIYVKLSAYTHTDIHPSCTCRSLNARKLFLLHFWLILVLYSVFGAATQLVSIIPKELLLASSM